ncbi:NYN domain-containing protein [Candidatus Micrarchaeota archaeon]|nr:NYN domain-containing protein [Candidatus Micrarchaeota archaeon]
MVGTIGIISNCGSMQNKEQCAVFIDAGYLTEVCKTANIRIDFLKFSETLAERIACYRFKTFYYDCAPYQDEKSTEQEKEFYNKKLSFFDAIKYLPRFEVKYGKLQRLLKSDGKWSYNQKMVDTLLSLDLLNSVHNKYISSAIIVSGDSDFVPAVKYAKDAGATIYAAYFKSATNKTLIHDHLKQECDDRIEIDKTFLELCKK